MALVSMDRAARALLTNLPSIRDRGSQPKKPRRRADGRRRRHPWMRVALAAGSSLRRERRPARVRQLHVAGISDRGPSSEHASLFCGRVRLLFSALISCRVCRIERVARREARLGHACEVCREPPAAAEWRPKMFGEPFRIFQIWFPTGETIARRHNLANKGRFARYAARHGACHIMCAPRATNTKRT